jgi:hypothetical protein
MTEDTKELAAAGSFGLLVHFSSPEGISRARFIQLTKDLLIDVGRAVVRERGFLIGHIKAFATTPQGTVQLNLIDPALGVDITDRLGDEGVRSGELKFMAAVVGLTDARLEEIMEESLERLRDLLQIDVEEHEHEGHTH